MKKFEITKEQIESLYNCDYLSEMKQDLKSMFPQAFESEFEVGKWYKFEKGTLGFFNGYNKESYGFHIDNNQWFEDHRWFFDYNKDNYQNCILATDKEVETALIADAKRRGFKEGVKIRHILYNMNFSKSLPVINNFNLTYDPNDNSLDYKAEDGQRFRLFKDGKWAEIFEEPIEVTLEEIAEKFNVNVEQLKIKK